MTFLHDPANWKLLRSLTRNYYAKIYLCNGKLLHSNLNLKKTLAKLQILYYVWCFKF